MCTHSPHHVYCMENLSSNFLYVNYNHFPDGRSVLFSFLFPKISGIFQVSLKYFDSSFCFHIWNFFFMPFIDSTLRTNYINKCFYRILNGSVWSNSMKVLITKPWWISTCMLNSLLNSLSTLILLTVFQYMVCTTIKHHQFS